MSRGIPQVEIRNGSIVDGGKFQDLRRSAYYGINKIKDAAHNATRKKNFTFARIRVGSTSSLMTETGVVKSAKGNIVEVYMYSPRTNLNINDPYWRNARFIEFDSYPYEFPSETPEINSLYIRNVDYELQRGFAVNMNLPIVRVTDIRSLKRRYQSYYNYVITYQVIQ